MLSSIHSSAFNNHNSQLCQHLSRDHIKLALRSHLHHSNCSAASTPITSLDNYLADGTFSSLSQDSQCSQQTRKPRLVPSTDATSMTWQEESVFFQASLLYYLLSESDPPFIFIYTVPLRPISPFPLPTLLRQTSSSSSFTCLHMAECSTAESLVCSLLSILHISFSHSDQLRNCLW